MKQLRAERYPAWLAQQHGLNGETAINIMTAALDAITKAATTGRADERAHLSEAAVNYHFIWPSNLAAPLPVFDRRNSAARPPAA